MARKSDLEAQYRAMQAAFSAGDARNKILIEELSLANQEIAVLRHELMEAQKPYSTYAARVEGERYGK